MIKAQKTFGRSFGFVFNFYTRWVTRKFKKVGKDCGIRPVLNLNHPENISLGNDVSLGIFCWIGTNNTLKAKPQLVIGNRVHIGAYSMIIAANKIKIGNNVLFSERVTVLDHYHKYEDVDLPVIDQPIAIKGEVIIEDECFIGINSVIIGNIRIGKHAVIGANSVVTHDVPPFSVVAGVPAKVLKRYDFEKKQWL